MKTLHDVSVFCLVYLMSLLLISCSDSNSDKNLSTPAAQTSLQQTSPQNVSTQDSLSPEHSSQDHSSENNSSQDHSPQDNSEEPSSYDATSWRTLIPESCRHFSDGCNTCSRAPGSFEAACTRKACFRYEQPECLDENSADMSSDDSPASSREAKTVTFNCDKEMRFSVVYHLYIADDQYIRLGADQVMFRDAQTHTATLLNRIQTASGERYQGDEIDFWTKGNDAMVNQDGEELYTNCIIS